MNSPASYEDPAWRILPSGHQFADDEAVMRYAIEIAGRGEGLVEPNPMVGAVIVDRDRRLVSCGYHQKFGQAHAEVNAIAAATGCCRNAVLFVTLEPCSHHGKTPPCADAVIAEGFSRVVVGCQDPAPHVAGRGLAKIREAGIDVVVGVCEPESQRLIAPFRMLYSQHRPWVHAKWAMTLDGRIAAASGHSKWISSEESRTRVHRLRGRMDAIITGAGTVRADNPELTARPPGPRQPIRVILDSSGNNVRVDSQLVRTLDKAPVLVCVRQDACVSTDISAGLRSLVDAGVEVLPLPAAQADYDSDSSALRGL
ncbi:MAG: bifunctional diaminohydroxyphosphoribosylaminopyrimidine deaminase/5-amino-6-(5-phosphoribosylamino)uracil reductase RibD, partial [Planctomycetaceae bacterium]|nr:bifunctional diaminohydroxyphosphoribosylaminopyrimidine deaminase/5-amino-6-(5-phosphoribosylamino)uracil reductase RibD [Planctomycetaceae bacterium]